MEEITRELMDWKDTVMSGEKRSEIIQIETTLWCPTKGEFLDEVGEVVSKAQAQITGDIAHKAGMQKVVDWLLSEGGFPWDMDEYPDRIILWQTFLKENGL